MVILLIIIIYLFLFFSHPILRPSMSIAFSFKPPPNDYTVIVLFFFFSIKSFIVVPRVHFPAVFFPHFVSSPLLLRHRSLFHRFPVFINQLIVPLALRRNKDSSAMLNWIFLFPIFCTTFSDILNYYYYYYSEIPLSRKFRNRGVEERIFINTSSLRSAVTPPPYAVVTPPKAASFPHDLTPNGREIIGSYYYYFFLSFKRFDDGTFVS